MQVIKSRMIVLLSAVALVATGCKGDKGDKGDAGTPGIGGQRSLVKITTEAAGANCATGGQKIETGIDADGNGVLDPSEVNASATTYVCNGAVGGSGQTALVRTTTEPAGANCAAGGIKIETGVDTSGDGQLQPGEVTATSYTCNGITGPPGTPPIATLEECAGCHRNMDAHHAARGIKSVSEEAVQPILDTDLNVKIRFNVKVDGVNANNFLRVARAYFWVRDAGGPGIRTSIDLVANPVTVASLANGDYEATLTGLGPAARAALTPPLAPLPLGTTFLVTVDTGNAPDAVTVVSHIGAPDNFTITNTSCVNCHGDNVFREPEGLEAAEHHGANPKGIEACMVCHNRRDNSETRLGTGSTVVDGVVTVVGTAPGTRLMGYVHGIHNSHNMPDGVYSRNGSTAATSQFSVGFPGFMQNCSTCHNATGSSRDLAAIVARPPSYALCISCHDSWDGFPGTVVGGPLAFHRTYVAGQNCTTGCHEAGGSAAAKATLAAFHNGLVTARAGVIWDGDDQSVEVGKTIRMAITSVTPAAGPPATLAIAWTAEQNTGAGFVPVNPCNQDTSTGAPVFFGIANPTGTPPVQPPGTRPPVTTIGEGASNLSILRAYAQANDWVNAGLAGSTAPGQPSNAVNVLPSNTTCAGNVATTVVNAETTTATHAIVSIQGKPQVRFAPAAGTNREVIQVRSPSPVFEFVPTTGAAPAQLRRNIVDINKCNSCHEGSMYQHGGNRVDSIDLCEMCHNPAANEQNRRIDMGLTKAETYDGLPGQTYDLRFMVHRIHSAGERDKPLVYYRTNGIYFFGTDAALARATNWPGTGCQVVFGSGPPSTATGTQCDTTNTTAVTKNHNYISIHYPRSLADCAACHVAGSVSHVPDPVAAVAVTVESGAAPYNNLLDDVLMGPTGASCMSCHGSSDPLTQWGLDIHRFGHGWVPSVFPNGRQTLLDAAAAAR